MHHGTDANEPQTLWDLFPEASRAVHHSTNTRAPRRPIVANDVSASIVTRAARVGQGRHNGSAVAIVESAATMRDRYDEIVKLMKARHEIRVRKWRTSNTGCAWQVVYESGRISRLIEAPYPRGPVSAAVFLHEVGHHAIGFTRYRPRCLEEYKAWEWALETMREFDLAISDRVHDRVALSLQYAVSKAVRRGIKRLPAELMPYL
ncbi:MAG: hypothetical protein GC159_12020 [Phycisphaera sp.]|nr:hypothetical protein [Phycisphaera sp.]